MTRLVLSQHVSRRDAKQQTVADLAGGARDGDANGGVHSCAPVGNCRYKKFSELISHAPDTVVEGRAQIRAQQSPKGNSAQSSISS